MAERLDIINYILIVLGETPVTSADSLYPSALSARIWMDKTNRAIQKRGWWFNKDYGLRISPNLTGEIVLPSNVLSVDPVDPSSPLVQRGNRLYDTRNHTYNIGRAVEVDVISLLPINELPESAANYLQYRAAYEMYVNDDGDEAKARRLEHQRNVAEAELKQEQLKNADTNARKRPAAQYLRMGVQQYGNARTNPNIPGGG